MKNEKDPFDSTPMLARSISTYEDAAEWRTYVEGLYDPTAGKKGKKKVTATKPATCSRTKKGTIVFRIKRDPKFITQTELGEFATFLGLEPDDVKSLLIDRKIGLREDEKDGGSKLSGTKNNEV